MYSAKNSNAAVYIYVIDVVFTRLVSPPFSLDSLPSPLFGHACSVPLYDIHNPCISYDDHGLINHTILFCISLHSTGAPVVEIPGRAHPVTPFFLEDVLERTGYMVDPKGDFAVKAPKGGGGGGGGGGGRGGGGGSGGGMKPGDWECPSCGNNCFASKVACNRWVGAIFPLSPTSQCIYIIPGIPNCFFSFVPFFFFLLCYFPLLFLFWFIVSVFFFFFSLETTCFYIV